MLKNRGTILVAVIDPHQAREYRRACEFLIERGAPGVILKRNGLEAFFAASLAGASLRQDVNRFVGAIARISPRAAKPKLQWKVVKQENWEQSWKRFIKARRVGKTFWVTPPWLEPPRFRNRSVITIEPGMAFGTGTHATTRGCMEFLEFVAEKLGGASFTALDVGTGSGILAIALARLGAKPIHAIDSDPVAVEVARENLRANGVSRSVSLTGAKLRAIRGKFDVVVANLPAETIVELGNDLAKKVAARGLLVLSGILPQKAGDVTRRLDAR